MPLKREGKTVKKLSKILALSFVAVLFASSFAACKHKETPEIKTLMLDFKTATLKAENDTVKILTASVSGISSEDLIWATSNNSVATITTLADNSSVTVRGVSEGTANITVTAEGLSDTCVVTVTEADSLVVLNPEIELAVGKSSKINYTTNLRDVTFTAVGNAGIVRVDDNFGNITALKAGNAVIEVKAGSVTKLVTIMVIEPSIMLSQSAVYLIEGAEFGLIATTSPVGEKVSFSSDNTDIVTVSANGLVTAISKGEAVITVSMTAYTGQFATCNIIVKEDIFDVSITKSDEPITQISIEPGVTLQLDAEVHSQKNNDLLIDPEVTWSVEPSDTNLISVGSDGLIIASKNHYGTAAVRVSYFFEGTEFYAKVQITLVNPYEGWIEISSKTQFETVMTGTTNLDKNIYLSDNINLEGALYSNLTGGTFTGTVDGRGFTISNFTIGKIFENIDEGGIIKNLGVTCNANLTAHRGIFGENQGGTIENCLFDVTMLSVAGDQYGSVISTYNSGIVRNTLIFARHDISSVNFFADFTQSKPAWATSASISELLYCSFGGSTVFSNGGTVTTEEQLKNASTFDSSWDRKIWNILDGEIPSLKTY